MYQLFVPPPPRLQATVEWALQPEKVPYVPSIHQPPRHSSSVYIDNYHLTIDANSYLIPVNTKERCTLDH